MTNRSAARRPASRSTASSRAEARRRARLASQGEAEDPKEEAEAAPASRPAGTGLLQRIFPAAPPLKGKPDPLAGFTYQGRARFLVTGLYLLRRNPIAWLLPGLVWFVATQYLVAQPVALVGTFVAYGALGAAGWFGWQRPWLFGLAGVVIGTIPLAGYVLFRYFSDPASLVPADKPLPNLGDVLVYLGYVSLPSLLIGALLGWYGGYLRRRLATPPPTASSGARRR